MTIVNTSEDCGNSPKNIFIQNLTIAFARGDAEFILSSVTDDINWNVIGQRLVQGKRNFAGVLEQAKQDRVAEMTIQHVVTHGKAGAVNGVMKLVNGRTNAFCYVYEFNGAKATSVREITLYLLEVG